MVGERLRNERRFALANVAQLVGASFCKLKGQGFDSRSGHALGLWVQFLVEVHERHNKSIFLSLSLPPFPSLKSISMSSGEDKREKEREKEDPKA